MTQLNPAGARWSHQPRWWVARLSAKACEAGATGRGDHRVASILSQSAIDVLLNPVSHIGFSAKIALEQAEAAKRFATEVAAHLRVAS